MLEVMGTARVPLRAIARIWLLVVLTLVAGGSGSLGAQMTCVPPAYGVPAMSGPPRWWDTDSDDVFPELNVAVSDPAELERFADPRWRGAVSHADGSPSAEHVAFRALYQQDSIYLSWQVLVDAGGLNPGLDGVWVAIKDASGVGVLIQLTLSTTDQALDAEPQPGSVGTFYSAATYTMTAATGFSSTPTDPLPWVRPRTKLWTRWLDMAGSAWWAFQMVVPISTSGAHPSLNDGINVSDPFEVWYRIDVHQGGGPPTPYYWPRDFTSGNGSGFPDLGTPSNWGQFTVTPTAETSCAGDLALLATDVGTTNTPSSDVQFTNPPAVNAITNTFFAKPRNVRDLSGADVVAGEVAATFYLADWGSLPDRNALAPGRTIADLWRKISPGTDPTNAGPIAPQTSASDLADINFAWVLDDCERYDYLPTDVPYPDTCPGRVEKRRHQCMLVELSATTPLSFVNQSVYRNMDFETASSFQREADISIAGLEPLIGGGPTRDVYIYVQTLNMPAAVIEDAPPVDTVVTFGVDTIRVASADTMLTLGPARVMAAEDTMSIDPPDTVLVSGPASIIVPVEDTIMIAASAKAERDSMVRGLLPRLTMAQIDSLMPTYRVHVYHESGDSISIGGVRRSTMRPQSSFGYWVNHDGALRGWQHAIEGVGITLDTIAPNFYRVSVPNDGEVQVVTTIATVEDDLRWLWILFIVILSMLIALVFWRSLHSKPRAPAAFGV